MLMIRHTIAATALDPALLTAAERLQYEGFQRRQQHPTGQAMAEVRFARNLFDDNEKAA